jgi:L-ascorbate metabolism protein UlaG (beta-lactamase superfamily)
MEVGEMRESVEVRLRWLGVAGIELTIDDQILAIDPFFTRPPLWKMFAGQLHPNHELANRLLPRANFILVSHAHHDHLMDIPPIASHTRATVYGSANTCRILAACGVAEDQIQEIQAGEQLNCVPFTVKVVNANHLSIPGFHPGPLPARLAPPLRAREYRMDACFSFLIQVEGLRFLVCGGGDPIPARRADVLIASLLRGMIYYAQLLEAVQPRLFIPVHWDDFFSPLSRPLRPILYPFSTLIPALKYLDNTRFKQMIAGISPSTRVLYPEIFQVYTISKTKSPAIGIQIEIGSSKEALDETQD